MTYLDDQIMPVIVGNLSTGRAEFIRDRVLYDGDIADDQYIDNIFSDHPDIAAPESVANPLRHYREM